MYCYVDGNLGKFPSAKNRVRFLSIVNSFCFLSHVLLTENFVTCLRVFLLPNKNLQQYSVNESADIKCSILPKLGYLNTAILSQNFVTGLLFCVGYNE